MITAKPAARRGRSTTAAKRLFIVTSTLVGTALGPRLPGEEDVERLTLLLSATIQGISSLVSTGRIPAEQGDTLLNDAVRVFLAGAFSNTA